MLRDVPLSKNNGKHDEYKYISQIQPVSDATESYRSQARLALLNNGKAWIYLCKFSDYGSWSSDS
jgi:hypothetical protein